jgi:hypothetical protein
LTGYEQAQTYSTEWEKQSCSLYKPSRDLRVRLQCSPNESTTPIIGCLVMDFNTACHRLQYGLPPTPIRLVTGSNMTCHGLQHGLSPTSIWLGHAVNEAPKLGFKDILSKSLRLKVRFQLGEQIGFWEAVSCAVFWADLGIY